MILIAAQVSCVLVGMAPAVSFSLNQRLESLVTNSPFGPVGQSTTEAAIPIEFRGWCAEGNREYFSIYEVAKKKSTWIELGVQEEGLYIIEYHADDESVSLRYAGRRFRLRLKKALIGIPALEVESNDSRIQQNVGLGGGDHPELLENRSEP
ncbi:MAG: hypothetical protein HOP00_02710 [Nitrospira sp.]|nr:hypothetical protein [Nitrospira sp.]